MAPRSGSESTTWPVRRATSYGGVVVRSGVSGPEVALIRPKDKDAWALPKGGKEPKESGEEAAVREVREETGIAAEIVEQLEDITYWFVWSPEQVRYRKTVRFFLMRAVGGEVSGDNDEVDEVRFFPIKDAIAHAAYPSERKVLQQAADRTLGS